MDNILEEKLIAFADDDYDGEDESDFKLIEDGEWIDDGKYSYRSVIVSHKDKFYSIDSSRTGSYYTDYDYTPSEVYEVVPKEVKKTIWKRV